MRATYVLFISLFLYTFSLILVSTNVLLANCSLQHEIIYCRVNFDMFTTPNLQPMHEHKRELRDSTIYLQFASDNHLWKGALALLAICVHNAVYTLLRNSTAYDVPARPNFECICLQTFEQWTYTWWQEHSTVSCADAGGSAVGTAGTQSNYCLLTEHFFLKFFTQTTKLTVLINQQQCAVTKVEWGMLSSFLSENSLKGKSFQRVFR